MAVTKEMEDLQARMADEVTELMSEKLDELARYVMTHKERSDVACAVVARSLLWCAGNFLGASFAASQLPEYNKVMIRAQLMADFEEGLQEGFDRCDKANRDMGSA